jgi:excinuclease ABC subunit A
MPQDKIIIHGAREHNLKNINLEIPRDKFVVITGISGSGKSSLAFDTIYAEGQRRYVESLSAYARQFLGQMEKPSVDQIEGLSPAVSIDQRGVSHNPRSTVGTATEVYDYLRLLYARIGIPHCPQCGRVISQQSAEQIVDSILELTPGTRILVLAPLVKDRKGHHQRIIEDVRKAGYVRVRVNGELRDVDEEIELERYKKHTIEVVVDRLMIPEDPGEVEPMRSRVTDSIETALPLGDGLVVVSDVSTDPPQDLVFSEQFACAHCGISLGEIEPRTFSFNSPHGACPTCQGIGTKMEIDPDLVIPDKGLSLKEGALDPWSRRTTTESYFWQLVKAVAERFGFSTEVPMRELSPEQIHILLYGSGDEEITVRYKNHQGRVRNWATTYEGVIPNLERRYKETGSEYMRGEIERYMTTHPCPACGGKRLKPESLAVTVADKSIDLVTEMSVSQALGFFEAVHKVLSERQPLVRVSSKRSGSAWASWSTLASTT